MPQLTRVDPRRTWLQNVRIRFYRGLDYLTLFLYVVVVSVGALLADYLIVFAVERTVASAVAKYPVVALAFDWFQIGSAFLVMMGAATHAVFSAYSQFRFEADTARAPAKGVSTP